MPIITGNKPIFRVNLGDIRLREIRKSTDLTGGLYKITYINKGPDEVGSGFNDNENIPTYVGGYPDYKKSIEDGTIEPNDFYLYIPDDMTAAESGTALGSEYAYKSHTTGGYDDNLCLNYIPAITKDFYRDLNLYCKGKQRRYSYNGVASGGKTETETIGVPDYDPDDPDAPTPDVPTPGPSPASNITSMEQVFANGYFGGNGNIYAYTDNYIPNCTTYAYGRALAAGFSGPTSGVHGASNGLNYPGSGGTAYKLDDGYTSDMIRPGDVVVGNNHVFFVEANGDATASGAYTMYGKEGTSYDAVYSWYYNEASDGEKYRTGHRVSISTEIDNGCHGAYYGFLRYTG